MGINGQRLDKFKKASITPPTSVRHSILSKSVSSFTTHRKFYIHVSQVE